MDTLTTSASFGRVFRDYYELTKPKIWYLLVFTAFASALTASFLFEIPTNPLMWVLLIVGVAAGSAAADTLTGYNDRDIDAIMDRTKGRPIPSGRISPKNAFIFGIILAAVSLVCSWFLNIYAFALMAFGLFDNIIVYSKWLKRISQTNIILGGFSGGAPAMIGYVAVTTQNIEIGIIMAGFVFFFVPTPIFFLSFFFYKKNVEGGVEKFSVVQSEKKSVRIIAVTTILMVLFSIFPFFINEFGLIYLIT